MFALWFLRFGIHLEENLGTIIQFFLVSHKKKKKKVTADVFLH